jgi:hypothetical protein
VAVARAWAARAERALTAVRPPGAAGGPDGTWPTAALGALPARYLEAVLATAPAPRHLRLVPSADALVRPERTGVAV